MIKQRYYLRFFFVILLTIVQIILAGCILGPDYKRPQTVAHKARKYLNVPQPQRDGNITETTGPWWERFGDPITKELVQKALENNTDLKAAAARVLRAKALHSESSGKRIPEVSYSLSGDRSKISSTFSGKRQSFHSTTFSQDLSVSYIESTTGDIG